jgi:hypothetical protein
LNEIGLLVLEKTIKKNSVYFYSFAISSLLRRGLPFICTMVNLYLSKNNLCQVWLKLAQQFWGSRKCKSLTDRRRRTGELKSSFVLSAQVIDWLFTVLRPAQEFWRRHHCRWRAAKFRPMLGAQGLWAGRVIYSATLAMTRCLSFSGLIRRTAPFNRLLRFARGCGGPIVLF